MQTFQPESRAVALAARHDVAGFLEGEIDRRRELNYRRFGTSCASSSPGPEQADPLQALTELAAGLESADAEIVGPAPLYRLRGRYRAQLVAKTRDHASSHRGRASSSAAAPAMRKADLAVVVDVDPQDV